MLARPHGPTCHTGTATCFGDAVRPPLAFLGELERIVQSRRNAEPESSYTARLLASGVKRCAQKVGEEGVEVALAATAGDREELVEESADLLYHLQVVLAASGARMGEVLEVLETRHHG